ncbi:MAG: Zn-ribbon domain-containing OB-fold protein [Calditrichaeota bacterium]|nr:MAG: Zn-ribbon domain-containing OB-fold protein [Calditrichota bacterium]
MEIPRNWRLQKQRYRLQGNMCSSCGKKYFPPRKICMHCKGKDFQTIEFSGKGTVYSFTTIYQSAPRFMEFVPYTVALVDLEEGVRITAQLTDITPEEVFIGMDVEMVVRRISEEGERGLITYGYKFRPVLHLESTSTTSPRNT